MTLKKAIEEDMIGKGQTLIGGLQANKKYPQPSSSLETKHPANVYRPTAYNAKRFSMSKWMMPRYMYAESKYPPYLGGSGYVMNRPVGECLLNATKIVPIMYMEDIYTTGLCARHCNVVRFHHWGFDCLRKYLSYKLKVNKLNN